MTDTSLASLLPPRRRLRRLLAIWYRNARTRAALRDVPPDRLDDIGLTAAQAAREARKPFWR